MQVFQVFFLEYENFFLFGFLRNGILSNYQLSKATYKIAIQNLFEHWQNDTFEERRK